MATREELIAQGKTPEQIDTAIVNRNSQAIADKLGQTYDKASGQFNVQPTPVVPTPITPPVAEPVPTPTAPVITPPVTEPIAPIVPEPTPVVKPELPVPQTQVEKTTTITPQGETVVKKETPQAITPDYNVGKGREQEILTNLNEGYSKDPAIQKAISTGDYETFKQAYGYDTADQTKKTTLDAFFQARQPKNSEAFLQILASGQKIENAKYRSSPEAADAQHRYDILSPYIGANSTTLYDAMVSGKLAPGSDAYQDLMKVSGGIETPAMTEAKIKYERKQQIDKVNGNIANLSGNKKETTTGLQKISDDLVQTKGMDYAMEFQKDVINNPAITEKVTELNGVTEQIKNLEYTKSQSLKEIMKRYPGISVGSAILQANQENEGINDELNQLYNKQSSLKANVDYATNLAEKMFGYKVAQNQEQVAQAQQVAQEERQFGRQIQLAEFQNELQAAQDERQFEKQKEMADIQNKYQESRDVTQYRQDLQKMGISDEMQTNRDKLNFAQQKELTAIQNKYQSSRDVQNYERDIAKMSFQYDTDPNAIAQKIENAKAEPKGFLSILGDGKITGYGGAYDGFKGLDVDGKKGDPVYGFNGKIVSIIDANFQSSPYGNSVVVEDNQGNQIRLSHLDSINVKPGQTISETDMIGALGNTGNVIPGKGGDGSHLDIRVRQAGASSEMPSKQVEQFLKGYGKTTAFSDNALAIAEGVGSLSDLTPTQKQAILPELNEIIKSKQTGDVNRDKIVKSALYSKELSDSTLQKMTDMQTVKAQLNNLESRLKKVNVGPIIGRIAEFNPYDTEAQVALAELAGITPKVARGIFGEVGVLTDTDIANYQRTLPNLKSTEEKNALVVDFMKKLLAEGVKNTIITQSKGQRNMAEFLGDYDEADAYVKSGQTQIKSTTGQTYSKEELLNALR